jgi:putative ABC transport system ATP-binding protein
VAVVETDDVVREYRTGGETVRALKGVDFAAAAGEFVSIVGPSGSGKSTLLNLLGLLDVPTSGTVTVEGRDVASLSRRERTRTRKRVVGFVFQKFHLIPTLSARENVEVPRLLENRPQATRDRATSLLEMVGLGDRTDHHPDELSGGQRQRVAIARSLVNDPDLILADEPTGNLDRETSEEILGALTRTVETEDVAVVAVTHDEAVNEYADRTIRLADGRIETVAGGDGDASPSAGERRARGSRPVRTVGAVGHERGV